MRPRPQIEDACQGTREKLAYQLQQQREELAHLSRVTTLGELATTLAHELNHPWARSVAMPKRREFPAKKTPLCSNLKELRAWSILESKAGRFAYCVFKRIHG